MFFAKVERVKKRVDEDDEIIVTEVFRAKTSKFLPKRSRLFRRLRKISVTCAHHFEIGSEVILIRKSSRRKDAPVAIFMAKDFRSTYQRIIKNLR